MENTQELGRMLVLPNGSYVKATSEGAVFTNNVGSISMTIPYDELLVITTYLQQLLEVRFDWRELDAFEESKPLFFD